MTTGECSIADAAKLIHQQYVGTLIVNEQQTHP